MKFVFLIGGFTGFLLAAATGWWSEHTPDRIIFDAALGCLAGAALFRWLWTVVLSGVRETVVARHHAALAAASQRNPPPKNK
jgi:hypothetical protein